MEKDKNTSASNDAAMPDQSKQQHAIAEALKQFGSQQKTAATEQVHKAVKLPWIYLGITFVFAVGYLLFSLKFFNLTLASLLQLQHFVLAGLLISLILAMGDFLIGYWVDRIADVPTRYNLTRLVRLLVGLAIFVVVIAIFFINWTAALVSLGVLSIVFGLALQVPLSNLFAWFYILIRQPYRVGDRIRISDATGDVIDVGYFDTTLWEFGGRYVSSDHPSGRIIKFPNALVLNQAVFNYSWPLFPYIWDEVHLYVAYSSDLEFVAETMSTVASEVIGIGMLERIEKYRELLSQTPVDEIEVNEKPVVVFRTHENTWLVAIVRYLVEPKQAGPVKTRILKKCMEQLNAQPERVLFPKGDAR